MSTRYKQDNCIYIQFYKKDNITPCIASEGYITFYPDKRKSLINTRLEIGEAAHSHIQSMQRLGKDFSSEKFEILTRYQWSNLK